MTAEPFLLTVAQLAVALAGFTGLLQVFRDFGTTQPLANEVIGRRFIVELSLVAVFAALIPIPLHALLPGLEWRIASVLLAVYFVEAMVRRVKLAHKLVRGGHTLRTPPGMVKALSGLTTLVAGAQIVNALRWNSYGVYELGLVWLLAVTCYQFGLFAARPHGLRQSP